MGRNPLFNCRCRNDSYHKYLNRSTQNKRTRIKKYLHRLYTFLTLLDSSQSLEEIAKERLQAVHIHCCRHSTRVTFRLFSCLGLLLILSSGVSYPSIFGIPFMFAFVICLIGLRWYSIIAMVRLAWKWLLFYNVIYISLVYIFQMKHIHDSVGDNWTRILGLVNYSHLSIRDWPVVVGYTSAFILFLMVRNVSLFEVLKYTS